MKTSHLHLVPKLIYGAVAPLALHLFTELHPAVRVVTTNVLVIEDTKAFYDLIFWFRHPVSSLSSV
jgi:hypothetical protein